MNNDNDWNIDNYNKILELSSLNRKVENNKFNNQLEIYAWLLSGGKIECVIEDEDGGYYKNIIGFNNNRIYNFTKDKYERWSFDYADEWRKVL